MGLSSAVTGSEVVVSPAARATVVRASALELEIGLIVTIEDIADTPGISSDSCSGPADRKRPATVPSTGGTARWSATTQICQVQRTVIARQVLKG